MEYRATKDIKKFLENFILILDLNKINLDEIIEDILQKILDVNESKMNPDQSKTDKISFDQARSALFTHDQGNRQSTSHYTPFYFVLQHINYDSLNNVQQSSNLNYFEKNARYNLKLIFFLKFWFNNVIDFGVDGVKGAYGRSNQLFRHILTTRLN